MATYLAVAIIVSIISFVGTFLNKAGNERMRQRVHRAANISWYSLGGIGIALIFGLAAMSVYLQDRSDTTVPTQVQASVVVNGKSRPSIAMSAGDVPAKPEYKFGGGLVPVTERAERPRPD